MVEVPLSGDKPPLKDHRTRGLSFMSFMESLSAKYAREGIKINFKNDTMQGSTFTTQIAKKQIIRKGLSEDKFSQLVDRIKEAREIEKTHTQISGNIAGMNRNLVDTISQMAKKYAVDELGAQVELEPEESVVDETYFIQQIYKFED